MIKEFTTYWEKNKGDLEKFLKTTKQEKYTSYESLVKALFEKVINPNVNNKFDTKNILIIDDGDYQGTQIFLLHIATYQPSVSDYVYTNTYYGSCSGCDTLLAISHYNDGYPNDKQVEDYMTLCLHLLQKCCFMGD